MSKLAQGEPAQESQRKRAQEGARGRKRAQEGARGRKRAQEGARERISTNHFDFFDVFDFNQNNYTL
jgi:hypothetical protein